MKIYNECFECLTRTTLRTIRFTETDKKTEREILQFILRKMGEAKVDAQPVDIVADLMDQIRERTGVDDPYESVKAENTRDALKIYPRMKKLVAESNDPFRTAVHIAALGNAIDFGCSDHFNIKEVLNEGLTHPLYAPLLDRLRSEIQSVPWFLFMADNAGETVFDRVLIETIHQEFGVIPIKYAVKSSGGLNDTMRKDAVQSGIDPYAEIVETGDGAAGTILRRCTEEFRSLFASAPMILSKGVGNYEGLSDNILNTNVYYLLKVKCISLFQEFNVDIGTTILWHPSQRE